MLDMVLESNQCKVKKRDIIIPSSFKQRTEIRIGKNLYDAMVEYARSC